MNEKLNNGKHENYKNEPYLLNNFANTLLTATTRGNQEYILYVLKNEPGVPAAVGRTAARTLSLPGIVSIGQAVHDGEYAKAFIVGGIPYIFGGGS